MALSGHSRFHRLHPYLPRQSPSLLPYLLSHAIARQQPANTIIRFMCSLKYDQPNYINQLIITAIRRRTETLELSMNFHKLDNKLVSNIFTCRTLTVLKLTTLVIWHDIPQINNPISRLKTLHLDTVRFMTRTHIVDFLFSFPILEELLANDIFIIEELQFHNIFNFPRTKVEPIKTDKIKCLPNLVTTTKLCDNKPIPLFLLSRELSLSLKIVSKSLFHFTKQITIS